MCDGCYCFIFILGCYVYIHLHLIVAESAESLDIPRKKTWYVPADGNLDCVCMCVCVTEALTCFVPLSRSKEAVLEALASTVSQVSSTSLI